MIALPAAISLGFLSGLVLGVLMFGTLIAVLFTLRR